MPAGSLTMVGTGIQFPAQMTIEARGYIEKADKLLYLVTEPIAAHYLETLNPTAESLQRFYEEGKDRFETYMQMVDRMLEEVRRGQSVCVAFYGHPGVFVLPSHEAVKRARGEGFSARMLPGISAQDCLFADLGVDPGLPGCQSYEATDFLLNSRYVDITCSLVLWQIGVIGVMSYENEDYSPKNLGVLADYLGRFYGPNHQVIIYEASPYPMYAPQTQAVALTELPLAAVSPISTLYVPPKNVKTSYDKEMLDRLSMDEQAIHSIEMKVYAHQTRYEYVDVHGRKLRSDS
jgi:Tetrapyrrole (Corrin/Porphyrin) Methylases